MQIRFPLLVTAILAICSALSAQDTLQIQRTTDFEINGNGSHINWDRTNWFELTPRNKADDRTTRAKALYSDKGIYLLYSCPDHKITATMQEHFQHLWEEDVVELFLWPDERYPVYFEYEVSPLNIELPILVPNLDGKFLGWRPWDYEGERKVRHQTHIVKNDQDETTEWRAEFFIPYALLRPLTNVPPQSGTIWRANLYRIDHDEDTRVMWTWQPVESSFHDFKRFGYWIFE